MTAEELRQVRTQSSIENNSIESKLLKGAKNELAGITVAKIFNNKILKDLEEKGFTITHSNTNTFITF